MPWKSASIVNTKLIVSDSEEPKLAISNNADEISVILLLPEPLITYTNPASGISTNCIPLAGKVPSLLTVIS